MPIFTSSTGRAYGRGRIRMVFTRLKITVLVPMHRARMIVAIRG